MFKFLSTIPQGYRKFVIVALGLVMFFILTPITFIIKEPSGQATVIGAIAGGIVLISTTFFKYNKDVHVGGKEENITK